MIKKLRYKFLGVTMLCIGLLLGAILFALNLSMTVSSQSHGFEMLEAAAEQASSLENAPDRRQLRPDAPQNEQGGAQNAAQEAPYSTPDEPNTAQAAAQAQPDSAPDRSDGAQNAVPFPAPARRPGSYIDAFRVFSIAYDKSGTLLSVDYNKETGLSEADILQLGEKVLPQDGGALKERGKVQSRYLYLVRDRDTFWQIYFLDYSVEHSMTYQLFWLCLAVGLAGMVVLFAAAFFLSGWMVKPVQEAFTQQKQFIADASHELKTPLTVINANAEVLSASLGQNKWLSHILEQTQRMNALIRSLLDLAKMDAAGDSPRKPAFADFDLSRAVSSSALSFESLAFETRKTYRMQIAENLFHRGDEQAIRQLVTILLDNAFAYSEAGGTVTVSLSPDRKSSGSAAVPADASDPVSLPALKRIKNPAKQDSSPAAGRVSDSFSCAAVRSVGDFCTIGNEISYRTKKVLTVYNTGAGISAEDQKHIFERFYRSDTSRSRNTGGYGLGLSIAASIARIHGAKISVQSDGKSYTRITVVF